MKNMKVSAKLLSGFLIVTALSILLAGIGIFSSLSINSNYTYLLDNPVVRERELHEMQYQFMMMRYRSANFAMEAGNADIISDTLTPQFQDAYDAFMENLDAYVESNENDPRRDAATKQKYTATANNLKSLVEQFKQAAEEVRLIALDGDWAGAATTLRDQIPLATEINDSLNSLVAPAIELVESESANMDVTAITLTIVLIVVAVICAAISVVLAFYIARIISKPLLSLLEVAKQTGEKGDLNFSPELKDNFLRVAKQKDEIGQSLTAFAKMMDRQSDIGELLERVAQKDLTVDVPLLGERDTMGNALKTMVDSLNQIFIDVNSVAQQVSTASNEVATGAQALAQGSTEQASTVEEISASINEITEQANVSVETASSAASASDHIRSIALEGNNKMRNLSGAVREMNEASQSIGQVIKAIDDIAFQTNILALNAAVEAARAGEHGKGFAVVADEVRNLAGKSADAAKETAALISANIEKAEMGLSLSEDTAESLRQIVEGVEQTTSSLGAITEQSVASKTATEQVNQAVDQVAQVIQQNSATSEESAAAAQEMSSQAQVLRQMIAAFKLKSQDGYHTDIPALPSVGNGKMERLKVSGDGDVGGDIIF